MLTSQNAVGKAERWSLLSGPNIRGSSPTPQPQSSYQLLPESEIILPCVQDVT